MSRQNAAKKKKQQMPPQDTSYIGKLLCNNQNDNAIVDTACGQQDFYEEYKRVLGISYELKKQMSQQKNLKEELFLQIKDLQKNMEQSHREKVQKNLDIKQKTKRRNRRIAGQIIRKFKCDVEFCQKQYGSEGSLLQHIKIKHPDLVTQKD